MATIRCENGHYYDGAKFAQCPHCGVLPVIQKENSSFTSNKGGFFKKIHFGRKKPEPMPEVRVEEEKTAEPSPNMEREVTIPFSQQQQEEQPTVALSQMEEEERTVALEEEERTVAMTREDENDDTEFYSESGTVPPAESAEDDEVTISYHEPEVPEVPEEPEDTEDDDVTISYREPEEPENPQKVEEYKTDSELEVRDYVAGWLVGIEGSAKGMDYRIVQGFNRMVIASNGKIEVKGVAAAADRAVVLIVYDNRKNQFFVLPQQDEIQLNGTQIQSSMELHSGDEIEFLQEKFEFVAFCREGRVWKADAQ